MTTDRGGERSSASAPFRSVGGASGDIRTHQLFPVNVWTAAVPWLEQHVPTLLSDIEDLLDGASGPIGPGRQTEAVLQDQPGVHWARAFETIIAFADTIAESLEPPWRSRQHFSWAIVFDGSDDYAADESFHTHLAAAISTILWIQLPEEGDASTGLGTVLRNPQKNVQHRYSSPDLARIPASPLMILGFPGYIEHMPEYPGDDVRFPRSRVAIVTDVCYY